MKKKTMTRFAGAIAMMSIMAPLGVGIASAQTEPSPGTKVSNEDIASLLDTTDTPSLTIHKYLGDPVAGVVADGTDVSDQIPEDRIPMSGVTFNVRQLEGLNPANLSGWQTYAGLNEADVAAGTLPEGVTLGDPVQMTTGENGTVTEEFAIGFYLVTEEPSPGRTTGAPFLVALPMTQPNNTEWNFDVHAHPKNQEVTVNKEVADRYAVVGSEIQYTITGDTVAPPANDGNFTRYSIVDVPPAGITLDSPSVAVSLIGGEAEEALVEGDFTVIDQDGDLRVDLTASGLTKLTTYRTANPAAQVEFTIDATVAENAGQSEEAPGIERNTVYLYVDGVPGDPDNPGQPGDVTDEVESRFMNVTLNKTDSVENHPLAGAVFELYRCQEGATLDNGETSHGPISVNGEARWTTGEDGTISLTGLQMDDFYNGAGGDDVYDYCFVEVKSPDGYELLPDPVPFDASNAGQTVTLDVINVPDNGGFELPRTGEAGIAGALVAGSIIAGAGAVYTARRRKSNELV